MNAVPDPAEIAAPRDPALYAPRRVLSPGFWAFIVFGLVCVAAGSAVTRFGPTWFRAPARAPAAAVAPEAPLAPTRAFAPSAEPASPPQPTSGPEIERLEQRLAVVEAGQQRTIDAAGAALAAASLADAARSGRPFADELASLARVLPLSPDVRGLTRLAEEGAPTRAGLAAEFDALAARASVAAHDPGRNADFLAKLRHALSSIVSIRQVGSTQGDGADAVLGRAQIQLNDGDVEGALRTVQALPPSAQLVLAPWRNAAERRVEIDRSIAAIRADALAGLARAGAGEPGALAP
ncbi:MAG: hypothetical protein J7521_17055 [Caulobacter sp.]|nr:hypothetical protein [Caulobacter sp.]